MGHDRRSDRRCVRRIRARARRGRAERRVPRANRARRPASWRARRPSSRSRDETARARRACSPARGSRSPPGRTRRASRSGSRAGPTRAPCRRRSSGGPGTGPRACDRSRRSSSTSPRACRSRESAGSATSSRSSPAASPSRRATRSSRSSGTSATAASTRSWITLPSFEPIPVAVIDSGVDAAHPDLAGKILDAESFVGGSAQVDTLGHGTFVAGLIGAGVEQRHRHRGSRAVGAAARREGRHEVARDPGRGGGEGDPLGRRQRRARHQHEPRRHPRPARSRSRHVLAARGRRGRVCGLERRRRRRCGRQLRPGTVEPVEVRELSGGAPARSRRQRDDRHGRRPDVLESRPDLQRHRSARAADPLGPSAPADGALSAVLGAGVLELRPRGVPRGAGDVVRRAAGERGRCRSAQPATDAAAGAGHADPPADDRRPRRVDRLRGVRLGS